MRNKFVKENQVWKEIKKVKQKTNKLEKQLALQKGRLDDLVVLDNYLCAGGIVPVSKKLVLGNDKVLQYCIMPIKTKTTLEDNLIIPANFYEQPYSHLDLNLREKLPYAQYKKYREFMNKRFKRRNK